jgi:hypothetical protein
MANPAFVEAARSCPSVGRVLQTARISNMSIGGAGDLRDVFSIQTSQVSIQTSQVSIQTSQVPFRLLS